MSESHPVIVVDYDSTWPEQFHAEATKLRERFGNFIGRIEHFGSTAVVGLAAKPVIDMLVEVESFAIAESEIIAPLLKSAECWWSTWRSDRPPGHFMLVKNLDKPATQVFHIHLAPQAHPLWDRLLFRDFLRNNPIAAREYELLKRTLAHEHRNDREAYTDGKADFVSRITDAARKQLGRRGDRG